MRNVSLMNRDKFLSWLPTLDSQKTHEGWEYNFKKSDVLGVFSLSQTVFFLRTC